MKKEQPALWVDPLVLEFLKDPTMSCLTTILYKKKSRERTIPLYIKPEERKQDE